MKKIICVLTLCVAFLTTAPSFAAPPPGGIGHGPSMGGRPPMHHTGHPPMGLRPGIGRPPMGPATNAHGKTTFATSDVSSYANI